MKKLLLMAAIAIGFYSQAQVAMPAPSTTQKITQDFGMGKIELTYSRPNIKGRKLLKEGSDLAPLGKLWRTGANAATKLKFTDNVTIGGKLLDTGSYVLYTIPAKGEWEVIINKGLTNWGTDGYKESEDVVRFKVPTMRMKRSAETFTMQFANIANESCQLHLMWGKTAVAVPITTNVKDRLRTQIEKALAGDKKPYQQAATFYYEWDKDYTKALENAKKSTDANPKAFWLFMLTAKIQKDMGDKTGAKASAEKCITLATDAKNDDYVKQATDLIKSL